MKCRGPARNSSRRFPAAGRSSCRASRACSKPASRWNRPGAGRKACEKRDQVVMAEFKPKTVYVIYIASTPEKVWEALTSSDFSRKYFWGLGIELEPKLGGSFALRAADGTAHVQ